MADNVNVSQGSGTVMATNQVGTVHYPRNKMVWGAPGTVNDTSFTNPMPVQQVLPQGAGKVYYNEILSVASGVLTTIITYTAPVGKTTYLGGIDISGTNIAAFVINLNATPIAKKYTYFGGGLNVSFPFADLSLNVGDVVTATVLHSRPTLGNFNASIFTTEN